MVKILFFSFLSFVPWNSPSDVLSTHEWIILRSDTSAVRIYIYVRIINYRDIRIMQIMKLEIVGCHACRKTSPIIIVSVDYVSQLSSPLSWKLVGKYVINRMKVNVSIQTLIFF